MILHQSTTPPLDPEAMKPMSKKKLDKVYFWKGMSVDSIPPVIALLDAAKARMQATNLKLLDQETMSKETFVSALCIWVHNLIQKNGIAWMEKELRQPFAELNEMVAEDQKMREALKLEEQRRDAAAAAHKEGFSKPDASKPDVKAKPKPKPGPKKGRKPGRRQGEDTAE